MPIYEFECADCGNRFERLQKIADADPTDCPACAKPSVRRRVTAPSFRLSGSGWYETDFKKDGDKKRNLAGADDAGGSGSAKSDSAPAATAATTESKPSSESKSPSTPSTP